MGLRIAFWRVSACASPRRQGRAYAHMARVKLACARPHGTCFRASPPAVKRRVGCAGTLMASNIAHRRCRRAPHRSQGAPRVMRRLARRSLSSRGREDEAQASHHPRRVGVPGSMRRAPLFRTRLTRCLAPRQNCIKYAVICIMIRPLGVDPRMVAQVFSLYRTLRQGACSRRVDARYIAMFYIAY